MNSYSEVLVLFKADWESSRGFVVQILEGVDVFDVGCDDWDAACCGTSGRRGSEVFRCRDDGISKVPSGAGSGEHVEDECRPSPVCLCSLHYRGHAGLTTAALPDG